MKEWIKANWKQIAVLVLSAASAIVIYARPEWRGYVLIAGAALATVGIRLQPIALPGQVPADEQPTKPVLPKDPPSGPLVLAFVVALALGTQHACSPSAAPAPAPVAAACISHRTALQLACVDTYATTAEIDACRAKVQADHDCTKDAGTE